MVFLVAGIAFKFGAAPFHMWLPDVYQGAPTPITLFIGSGAEAGRVRHGLPPARSRPRPDVGDQWQLLLAGLAALSLAIGNVSRSRRPTSSACWRIPRSRMSASCCSAWPAAARDGYAAAMFYAISYAMMAAAAFGAIVVLSRQRLRGRQDRRLQGPERAQSLDGGPGAVRRWSRWPACRRSSASGPSWLVLRAAVRGRPAVAGDRRHRVRGDRRVLLPARDQGDVLRRAGRRAAAGAHGPAVAGGVRVNALALLVLGFAWSPLMAWCQQALRPG